MNKAEQDKTILSIDRLLRRKLNKYSRDNQEEYYQEGMLGALLALKTWDKDRTVFNTYGIAAAMHNVTKYAQRNSAVVAPTDRDHNRKISHHRAEFSDTPKPSEIRLFSKYHSIPENLINAYFISVDYVEDINSSIEDTVLRPLFENNKLSVINKLLTKVSKTEAHCIREHYLNERSQEDIAKELNVKPRTITCTIYAGLTKLRNDTEFKKEDVL